MIPLSLFYVRSSISSFFFLTNFLSLLSHSFLLRSFIPSFYIPTYLLSFLFYSFFLRSFVSSLFHLPANLPSYPFHSFPLWSTTSFFVFKLIFFHSFFIFLCSFFKSSFYLLLNLFHSSLIPSFCDLSSSYLSTNILSFPFLSPYDFSSPLFISHLIFKNKMRSPSSNSCPANHKWAGPLLTPRSQK